MRIIDAGAPELFFRLAADGAQADEDIALRDIPEFVPVSYRAVGRGQDSRFGIAPCGLVIRAVRFFDDPGLSAYRLLDGDLLHGRFRIVFDGEQGGSLIAVLRELEARFGQGAFYVLLENLIGGIAVLLFRGADKIAISGAGVRMPVGFGNDPHGVLGGTARQQEKGSQQEEAGAERHLGYAHCCFLSSTLSVPSSDSLTSSHVSPGVSWAK